MNRTSDDAFKNAIAQGKMTTQGDSDAFEHVSHWMYMGSKDAGDERPEIIDSFKHIDTREYMHVHTAISFQPTMEPTPATATAAGEYNVNLLEADNQRLRAALQIAVDALRNHNIDESMAGEFEILTDALNARTTVTESPVLVADNAKLRAALEEVELCLTQARLASNIGKKKDRTDFLRGSMDMIAKEVRVALSA